MQNEKAKEKRLLLLRRAAEFERRAESHALEPLSNPEQYSLFREMKALLQCASPSRPYAHFTLNPQAYQRAAAELGLLCSHRRVNEAHHWHSERCANESHVHPTASATYIRRVGPPHRH